MNAVSAPERLQVVEPPVKRGASLVGGRGGFWFVLPFLVVYAAFVIFPLLYGLVLSFFDTSLVRADSAFVGLDNYAQLFADPEVWRTLGVTLLFTVGSTIPLVVIALVMALLVQTGVGGQWFWRFAYFAPFLLPVATVALIFQWLFSGDFGLFNGLLTGIGLPAVGWLTEPEIGLWSVVILTVWWTVGFNFLLYLAALQAIPEQLHEAAEIDGAGGWRRLFSITLPLLGRTTALVVVLQVLASLKLFDQAYILFKAAGGPGGSATPILQYVYETGFVDYRLGYASAISYAFFVLIVVVALAQARLSRGGER